MPESGHLASAGKFISSVSRGYVTDDTNLLRKLQSEGLEPHEINELSNELFNMAGINIIAQFGAKLDAMQAQLAAFSETTQTQLAALSEVHQTQMEALREANRSQWEALDGRYKLLLWLIGGVGGVLTFILAYGTFFSQ